MSQWIPKSMFSEYIKRQKKWDGLFLDLSNGERYQSDLTKLANTFYEFLTNQACSQYNELMLTMRFNGYIKLLLSSLEIMVQDTALKRRRIFNNLI